MTKIPKSKIIDRNKGHKEPQKMNASDLKKYTDLLKKIAKRERDGVVMILTKDKTEKYVQLGGVFMAVNVNPQEIFQFVMSGVKMTPMEVAEALLRHEVIKNK